MSSNSIVCTDKKMNTSDDEKSTKIVYDIQWIYGLHGRVIGPNPKNEEHRQAILCAARKHKKSLNFSFTYLEDSLCRTDDELQELST